MAAAGCMSVSRSLYNARAGSHITLIVVIAATANLIVITVTVNLTQSVGVVDNITVLASEKHP